MLGKRIDVGHPSVIEHFFSWGIVTIEYLGRSIIKTQENNTFDQKVYLFEPDRLLCN